MNDDDVRLARSGLTRVPDCYQCLHRVALAGTVHSGCRHPNTRAIWRDPYMILASHVGKRGGPVLIELAQLYGNGPSHVAWALGVVGNPIGVGQGWFCWPVNFDPVWLESCQGFEAVNHDASGAVSPGARAESE